MLPSRSTFTYRTSVRSRYYATGRIYYIKEPFQSVVGAHLRAPHPWREEGPPLASISKDADRPTGVCQWRRAGLRKNGPTNERFRRSLGRRRSRRQLCHRNVSRSIKLMSFVRTDGKPITRWYCETREGRDVRPCGVLTDEKNNGRTPGKHAYTVTFARRVEKHDPVPVGWVWAGDFAGGRRRVRATVFKIKRSAGACAFVTGPRKQVPA